MRLCSPGSVLAAGSTSGHGCNLPEKSTEGTQRVASSTHPLSVQKGAAVPPLGRLTKLQKLE